MTSTCAFTAWGSALNGGRVDCWSTIETDEYCVKVVTHDEGTRKIYICVLRRRRLGLGLLNVMRGGHAVARSTTSYCNSR